MMSVSVGDNDSDSEYQCSPNVLCHGSDQPLVPMLRSCISVENYLLEKTQFVGLFDHEALIFPEFDSRVDHSVFVWYVHLHVHVRVHVRGSKLVY